MQEQDGHSRRHYHECHNGFELSLKVNEAAVLKFLVNCVLPEHVLLLNIFFVKLFFMPNRGKGNIGQTWVMLTPSEFQ